MPSKLFGTVIILAGGMSRRMGVDKQRLVINEHRLLTHLIDQLTGDFDQVVIVSNTPGLYTGWPVDVVQDQYVGLGPLAGLQAGLSVSRSQYSLLLACDMPGYDSGVMHRMQACLQAPNLPGVVRVDEQGRWYPFHGFYNRDLLAPLVACLQHQQLAMRAFLREQGFLTITDRELADIVEPDQLWRNLNTPDDVEQFESESGVSVSWMDCD